MQKSKKRCSAELAELIYKSQNLGIVHIIENDISTIPIYRDGVLKYYKYRKIGYYAYRLESIRYALELQCGIIIKESFENIRGFDEKLYVFRNKYTITFFSKKYTEGLDKTLRAVLIKLTSEST